MLCVFLQPAAAVCLVQVYLITELVTGGELLEAVLQRGTYSEAEARLAFVQLLKGIEYLHSKCVPSVVRAVCLTADPAAQMRQGERTQHLQLPGHAGEMAEQCACSCLLSGVLTGSRVNCQGQLRCSVLCVGAKQLRAAWDDGSCAAGGMLLLLQERGAP